MKKRIIKKVEKRIFNATGRCVVYPEYDWEEILPAKKPLSGKFMQRFYNRICMNPQFPRQVESVIDYSCLYGKFNTARKYTLWAVRRSSDWYYQVSIVRETPIMEEYHHPVKSETFDPANCEEEEIG